MSARPAVGSGAAAPTATAGSGATWTRWQPLTGLPALPADVLAEILDGGQAFRWHRLPDSSWLGIWSSHVVQVRPRENAPPEWRAPAERAQETSAAIGRYFAVELDFAKMADALPWRSDPHLAQCLTCFPGLRILRQPFGETLLGFLCSATKQIVQIKQMLALLAERHGAPIATTEVTLDPAAAGAQQPSLRTHHRLPTWPELAPIPEATLRACLLGFRARYIADTARFLAAHPDWLDETESLPYAQAKERLCGLPGVGEKVADCVLLFGAGRLDAFPVDVWILKTLARRYGLEKWRPPQLAQFGRVHFGPLAGLAQQYLFAWERRNRSPDQNPPLPTGARRDT